MLKQVYDQNGKHMGTFDGGYISDNSGKMLLRIDEEEIYSLDMPCKYLGSFDGEVGSKIDGSIFFRVED